MYFWLQKKQIMEAVPYTIFRLGPSSFTECYPIDDACISKEILNDKISAIITDIIANNIIVIFAHVEHPATWVIM